MNQRKAKRIRKRVFGDNAQRPTKYYTASNPRRCAGLRAKYKEEKKQ